MGCAGSSEGAGAGAPGPTPVLPGPISATTFQFQCSNCKQILQVPNVGVDAQCPYCQTVNRVEGTVPPPPKPLVSSTKSGPDPSIRKLRTQMSGKLKDGAASTKDLIEAAVEQISKKPCKYGLKCYRRKGEHLEQFYHPDNEQYALSLWKFKGDGIRGEFLTLQQCMKFMDPFDKGIVDDKELLGELLLQIKGDDAPTGEDLQAIWDSIDDDGNGFVSFAEFIEWADGYGIGLPVGLEEQNGGSSASGGSVCRPINMGLKCGFPGCTHGPDGGSCTNFMPRKDNHNLCRCGHKRSVHTVQDSLTEIQVPSYWIHRDDKNWSYSEWVDVSDKLEHFQALMDASTNRVWTRDRGRTEDGRQRPVPSGYTVCSVKRNENKRIWRKYHLKQSLIKGNLSRSDEEDKFEPHAVKTTQESVTSHVNAIIGDPLDQNCNEWLLWHGTSLEGAKQICNEDFKQRYAGSATGTLYGPGTYFAESCTKADEYAKEADVDGATVFTILLCRVTGGLVKYNAEVDPDAQALTDAVLHDSYDSVLGDREACRNTFREFVIFGSDQVYPEYIVHYTRNS